MYLCNVNHVGVPHELTNGRTGGFQQQLALANVRRVHYNCVYVSAHIAAAADVS